MCKFFVIHSPYISIPDVDLFHSCLKNIRPSTQSTEYESGQIACSKHDDVKEAYCLWQTVRRLRIPRLETLTLRTWPIKPCRRVLFYFGEYLSLENNPQFCKLLFCLELIFLTYLPVSLTTPLTVERCTPNILAIFKMYFITQSTLEYLECNMFCKNWKLRRIWSLNCTLEKKERSHKNILLSDYLFLCLCHITIGLLFI